MEKEKEALRFNTGKLRYDLIPPSALEGLAKVLTYGHEKYAAKGGDRNWERGLPWESVAASLFRHFEAFRAGEDYDKESGLLHMDHVLTNASFIREYYTTHPELDNRKKLWEKHKNLIALDLDDCIFDWSVAFAKKYQIKEKMLWWDFSYATQAQLKELEADKDFWVNLPIRHFPAFVPHCYITARNIPLDWIQESLEKNNLPCRPVYIVGWGESKKDALIKSGANMLIDDKLDNIIEAESIGVTGYLMDTPQNARYNVGARRLYNLEGF